ncbi:MAG TPA: hypothetical protein VG711_10440, partial [Phycisphaerales bacterium]|nr:hypothetical protein [Phycisphaerales bacterium]
DDQVDAETRHRAERHLVDCAACRTMLDDAERINKLIAADAEDLVGERRSALSDDFISSVLDRTVNATRNSWIGRRWINWTGWTAAAACLALSMFIWINDRREGVSPGTGTVTNISDTDGSRAAPIPSVYRTNMRSWIVDDQASLSNDDTDAGATTSLGALSDAPRISSEDSQGLYSAAVVLGMLKDQPDADKLEQIKRIIAYDDLINRLNAMKGLPTKADRAAITETRDVLRKVTTGDFESADVSDIATSIGDHELEQRLRSLSARADELNSL